MKTLILTSLLLASCGGAHTHRSSTAEHPSTTPEHDATATPPAHCDTGGEVLFEVALHAEPRMGKMPTWTNTLYETGGWTHLELDASGKTTRSTKGCLADASVEMIRRALAGAPLTISHSDITCEAIAMSSTLYTSHGKALWNDRMCSGNNLDEASRKALGDSAKILSDAIEGAAPAATMPAAVEPAAAAPTPAAATPLAVTWKADADFSSYVTPGSPAISADGTKVLYALPKHDAHRTTELALVVTDLRGAVVEKLELPKLTAAVPTAAALQKATDFLNASQKKYGWRPLAWHELTLREQGGDGSHATIEGFDVALIRPTDETVLRISKGGKPVVAKIDLEKDRQRGTHADTEKCGGTPHLDGIAIDESHSLAVIAIGQISRDTCFVGETFMVHSWAKSR